MEHKFASVGCSDVSHRSYNKVCNIEILKNGGFRGLGGWFVRKCRFDSYGAVIDTIIYGRVLSIAMVLQSISFMDNDV